MSCSILVPQPVAKPVIKRLARLAKKAGVEVVEVPGNSYVYRKRRMEKTHKDDWGTTRVYTFLEVDTTQVMECSRVTVGDMPKFNGHTFLGKLVHTEAGNLLAMAPHAREQKLPSEWREAKPTCDHCNTQRSRTETFIIQTPEGAVKRVGRNCLADFLMGDPAGMVALSLFEDALREYTEADPDDDEKTWGGALRWTPTMFHFLCCAFASVETNGFVKADAGVGTPTKFDAMFLADGYNATHGERRSREDWKKRQPTEDHWVEAIGALLWVADEDGRSSEYIHNLQVSLQMTTVGRPNSGLVASLPMVYARHLGKLAELRRSQPLPTSQHLGSKGERMDLKVLVVGVHSYESQDGEVRTVVKARTTEGSDVVTFTSGKHPLVEDIGKQVSVRGTVKDHSHFAGRAQTVLSRCVWS